MDSTEIQAQADALSQDLEWLHLAIRVRLNGYFAHQPPFPDLKVSKDQLRPPDLAQAQGPYARFIQHHGLDKPENRPERVALVLALAPHLTPQLLDMLLIKNEQTGRYFSEFGGVTNAPSGFLPTGQTLLFILSGNDLARRLQYQRLFDPSHMLFRENVLTWETSEGNTGSPLTHRLDLTPWWRDRLITGKDTLPEHSIHFPASRIETALDWGDLVLEQKVWSKLDKIRLWLRYKDQVLGQGAFGKRIAPGYRCLFSGPSGTGKTLTAKLIGKEFDRPVFRIDLSQVISKYIGETEKNLERVFSTAEKRDWILFFDEADALFGQRGQTQDARDRYANQEVAYLLQRIEDYPGLVILASNLEGNIDPAFTRRFQSVVYFPIPKAPERLELWQRGLNGLKLSPDIDIEEVARRHELSGGTINNVLLHCALYAAESSDQEVSAEVLLNEIRDELKKSGKIM